jgi:sugar phosphate isomerase/epimerase
MFFAGLLSLAAPPAVDVFAPDNLVAWCVVPFDAKKRGPEERAAMLAGLGFRHFAYDWRAEHLPTFDAELTALEKRKIELTAVWFPAGLTDDAKALLAGIRRHKLTPQLWVMMTDPAPKKPAADKLAAAVAALKPVVAEAEVLGCKVGLYNHGDWFGEPENQIAVIEKLGSKSVGLVYNLHHGHAHLDRFPKMMAAIKPHLLCLNLNGMVPSGDAAGKKILPLGQGTKDLELLKVIRDSGYTGRVGIIGHTVDDAEEKLKDDLDGLAWLRPQLDGKSAGPKPAARTIK